MEYFRVCRYTVISVTNVVRAVFFLETVWRSIKIMRNSWLGMRLISHVMQCGFQVCRGIFFFFFFLLSLPLDSGEVLENRRLSVLDGVSMCKKRARMWTTFFFAGWAYHDIMVIFVQVMSRSLGYAKYGERFAVQLEELGEKEKTKGLECGSTCINVGSMER